MLRRAQWSPCSGNGRLDRRRLDLQKPGGLSTTTAAKSGGTGTGWSLVDALFSGGQRVDQARASRTRPYSSLGAPWIWIWVKPAASASVPTW